MRKPRELREGAKYHVIARANRGEFILRTDGVKELLLETIRRAKKKYDFQILNLCIMDNHVHLIIRPGQKENLSRIMQWILSVFAINFNHAFKLKGHVWYDRFKSIIINNIRQLVDTFHYISHNPIKANIVAHALEYMYNGLRFVLQCDDSIMESPPHELLCPYLI